MIQQDIKILSKQEVMEEFMFLGLRIIEGIKKPIQRKFGLNIEDIYGNVIEQSIKEGVIGENGDKIFLTEYGLDVSNYVLARFLLD